ncbi:hypothetical protein MP638_007327 [Amoeboaphelidium occidentale]|nr:hypothetical protein MP638_007327 [Amoeboaphelidium occidentale]
MGNVQTTEIQTSELISIESIQIFQNDSDVEEHHAADLRKAFVKFRIRTHFKLSNCAASLKAIITKDMIFDDVQLLRQIPFKRTSELRHGLFEDLGMFRTGDGEFEIEVFVPRNLGERMLNAFLLMDTNEEENVVVCKVRGIVALEEEFQLSEELESRVSIERMSRKLGLNKFAKRENEIILQSVIHGLQDTLNELQRIKKGKIEYVEATDGIRLSYRSYYPQGVPEAVFIIIAGNSHFLDIVASQTSSQQQNVLSFILELRGFGNSGGERGFAPSKEQIWVDIKTFIRFVKLNYPGLPVFVGGHYHQGGLLLNYATWKDWESVDGLVFVSPDFGVSSAEATNREAINRLQQSQGQKTPRKTSDMYISSLTESLFGKQVQQFFLSEHEHEVNPKIVDSATHNFTKAFSCYNPKKQFDALKKPFAFYVGEKEELFIPEKLVHYPRAAKVASSINILPGLTHMGVLSSVGKLIADWIVTLDDIKKVQLTTEFESVVNNQDVLEGESDSVTMKHSKLRDLDLVVKNVVALGLDKEKNVKPFYLLANDGSQIRYNVFTSGSNKKVIANVVFLQTDIKVLLPWLVAQKCDVAAYALDLRGIDNANACFSSESIFSDVKVLIRHLKFNDPEMPLILGGHGFGASVALNYSAWKYKEEVNGYLIISPVIDMNSPHYVDQKIIKHDSMRSMYSTVSESSWFSPNKSFSHSGTFRFLNAVQRRMSTIDLSGEDQVSSQLWDSIVCRNIFRLLKNLNTPLGLWIGDQDELVESRLLIQEASTCTKDIPLKEISLVPHSSHMGNLITCSAFVVPFIKRFAKIVGPSLSFKIRNPCLEDFEKIQFIGRGSFGRVYLVQHKVSEKYFAMKVLRKADIYKAKEVKHVINERNVLRDMNSSFIVSFIGSFQDDQCLYIIMEYAIGGELFTQLSLQKRFSNETAKFYAAEVLLFFEDIHSKQIIYRDLKPENILIDAMGHIKIVDMGFAKYLTNRRQRTSSFCGTPQYISPEIILNAELGGRGPGYNKSVDFYALGILIYEMLVGYTPFHDSNVAAIYRKVLYGNVEFPWGFDNNAKDLIKSLLNRNPSKRLGCGPGGIDDIKKHKWFKGIEWDQLRRREVPAPYVPKFSHAGDTSNFIAWGKADSKVELWDNSIDENAFSGF